MTGPTLPTIKRLFAISGNRCAFPGCRNQLVDTSGKVTARICHICAKSSRGPRYDPTQTDAKRHDFYNLMLLCPIHHDVIDADESTYSVSRLLDIKHNHEASVRPTTEPSDEIVRQLLAAGGTVAVSYDQSGGITAGTINIHTAPDPRFQPLPSCFLQAKDALSALIERNFLFEFQGQESDYMDLLSGDLRRLFFSLFNKHLRNGTVNRLLISGREGSGKTFNTLLLSLRLSREGYKVYYCRDIRENNLNPRSVRTVATSNDDSVVLIIDNVQHDLVKAEQLVSAISQAGAYEGKPLFLFLTRPLDKDTLLDTFGVNTPVLQMREHFIDFEHLVALFFQKLGIPEAATTFLESIASAPLPSFLLTYRNMAFWNELLRSITRDSEFDFSEEEIFKRTHAFLRKTEPLLFDLREPVSRLLPFFAYEIDIDREYAAQVIGNNVEEVLHSLSEHGVISIEAHDCESPQFIETSTLVVAHLLHPTKAKILAAIFRKYYQYSIDPTESISDYAEQFFYNLYHLLGPYSDADELRMLYRNPRIINVTRRYFLERRLGKKLDRVIRRLEVLDSATIDQLFDSEVIAGFGQQVNDNRAYIVSKMYLFRVLYKVSPKKAYELFCHITPEAVTETFLADETEGGITSFAKWMEVFKNIYYDAPNAEAKELVQAYVKKVIDQCQAEFLRRFEARHDYFTQMHWLLKRLHGLRLGNYFLGGIPPRKIIEFIRMKDTNIVELCRYVLFDARYTFDESGQRYYDIMQDALTYGDLKRVFDNRRSDLYDLVINATHDFVVKALVRYAEDAKFRDKVVMESAHLRKDSLRLIRTNCFLTDEEKDKVAAVITEAGGG